MSMLWSSWKSGMLALVAVGGLAAGAAGWGMAPQNGGGSVNPGAATTTNVRATAKTFDLPLPADGQRITVRVKGPGVANIHAALKNEKGQFHAMKWSHELRSGMPKHDTHLAKIDGDATKVQALFGAGTEAGTVPFALPSDDQTMWGVVEGPDAALLEFEVKPRNDGRYDTRWRSLGAEGAVDEVRVLATREVSREISRWLAPAPRPSASVAAIQYKYVPLDEGQTAEDFHTARVRLEAQSAEGWEFCGSLDMDLRPAECRALRDGKTPEGNAGDEPSKTYRVLVFKRPNRVAD